MDDWLGDFSALAGGSAEAAPAHPRKKKRLDKPGAAAAAAASSSSSSGGGGGGNVQASGRAKAWDATPWPERNAPTSEAELAVHKKKVEEVRDWLLRATATGCTAPSQSMMAEPRVGLLTGPPGAGKSATVALLASELNLEISEWINPSEHLNWDSNNDGSTRTWDVSIWKQFHEFVLRAQRYKSLSLSGHGAGRRLIVVEDLPTSIYYHAADFQELVRRFARTSRFPIMFIMSSSTSTNATKPYTLFNKAILDGNVAQEIKFNPVSQTALVKALTRVCDAESAKSKLKTLSIESIKQLALSSAGDIRCAINSLQFLSLRGRQSSTSDAGGGAAGKKQRSKSRSGSSSSASSASSGSRKKKGKGPARMADKDDATVASAGSFGRDSSLVVFHALGKILNAKRFTAYAAESDGAAAAEAAMPAWTRHHHRLPLRSDLQPETIIEQAPVPPSTFGLYLQENYLPFFSEIDEVVEASDHLSSADVLDGAWEHRKVAEMYSSAVAARGLLHANKTPAAASWRPLFKPRFFAARKEEAIKVETLEDAIAEERKRGNPAFNPFHATSATVARVELLPALAKISRSRSRSGSRSSSSSGSATTTASSIRGVGSASGGRTFSGGGGGGVGTLQSFSPALAKLLGETRAYSKFPTRNGSSVDKDAAFSDDEDDRSSIELADAAPLPGGGGAAAAAAPQGQQQSQSQSQQQSRIVEIEDDIEDDSDF